MFLALSGAILLAGCGNGDTTSPTTFNNGSGDQPFKPTTHLEHRALVTNYYASNMAVADTTLIKLTTFTFPTGNQPTYMQPSPDGTLTLVNNTGSNTISSLNNNLEAVKATVSLSGYTESFVTSQSNKVGFAAVPNYSNGSFRIPGAIVRFNPTDGTLNTQIQFPNVLYLGMDPAEKHLMAFTQSDYLPYWVDLSVLDPNTQVPPYYQINLTDGSGTPVLLSRPVAVYFSSDNSKAYVLSCGIECGGTQPASVTVIDTTTIKPASSTTGSIVNATALHTWTVKGAQNALFDSANNKLYLAGSTGATTGSGSSKVYDGWLTALDLTQTASSYVPPTIAIGNGTGRIVRKINSAIWVGARNCGPQSCLSMVPISTFSAAIAANATGALSTFPANGDATGITFVANDGFIYTIEGGELFIYDNNLNVFISQYNTDIKGQAFDVLYID
jgi:DNA-binding beta-propeller fold protein YncE